MVRWLSWIDQHNFFVVCPQVELMAVAKTLRVDGMSFLLAAFSYDGVHLSTDGYRDLFNRLAMVLNSEPWQYLPPTVRMSDPGMALVRAPAARRPLRDRLGHRGVAHLPRDIEVIADASVTMMSRQSSRRRMRERLAEATGSLEAEAGV